MLGEAGGDFGAGACCRSQAGLSPHPLWFGTLLQAVGEILGWEITSVGSLPGCCCGPSLQPWAMLVGEGDALRVHPIATELLWAAGMGLGGRSSALCPPAGKAGA